MIVLRLAFTVGTAARIAVTSRLGGALTARLDPSCAPVLGPPAQPVSKIANRNSVNDRIMVLLLVLVPLCRPSLIAAVQQGPAPADQRRSADPRGSRPPNSLPSARRRMPSA